MDRFGLHSYSGITVPGRAQDGGERKKIRYGSRQRPKKPKQGQSWLEIMSRPHSHTLLTNIPHKMVTDHLS